LTVTSLDAAADRDRDETGAALGDMVLDSVRFTAAALAGALDGGEGDDTELARSLTAGRSYAELHAMVLLLGDCADPAAVTRACGINPGLAAANAKRIAEARHKAAEYGWLRDGGVIQELAAERVGVTGGQRVSELEAAYRAGKNQRREEVA
jgi:hypothetical protein